MRTVVLPYDPDVTIVGEHTTMEVIRLDDYPDWRLLPLAGSDGTYAVYGSHSREDCCWLLAHGQNYLI